MSFKIPEHEMDLFLSHCDDFSLERSGKIIQTEMKGFFCSEEYPSSVQFLDFKNCLPIETDWIIHIPTGRRLFVSGIKPIADTDIIVKYQSEYEYNNQVKQAENIQFNIGTIQGPAIVGNQANATINIGATIEDLKSIISSKSTEDQEILNKLLTRLEIVTEDNQPVSKGTFAKFSDVLVKHQDVAIAFGQILTTWLTTNQ